MVERHDSARLDAFESRACRCRAAEPRARSTRSGACPSRLLKLDRLSEHRETVLVDVLVVRVLVDLELAGRALRAERVQRCPCRRAAGCPAPGHPSAAVSRARPRCARCSRSSSRDASSLIARTVGSVTVEPELRRESCGAQHPQRVIAERDFRRPWRRDLPREQVLDAARTGRRARARGSRSAIALTVKSRRTRSASSESPNATTGLRVAPSYASARYVVISTVWRPDPGARSCRIRGRRPTARPRSA